MTVCLNIGIALLLLSNCLNAQPLSPQLNHTGSNQNRLQFTFSNGGRFFSVPFTNKIVDPITGELLFSAVFPARSDHVYSDGMSLLCGAVVSNDTLVSELEFTPIAIDDQPFVYISRSFNNAAVYSDTARSVLDITCRYSDTVLYPLILDVLDQRPHRPLGVLITQRIMVWKGGNLNTQALIELTVTNMGPHRLDELVIGIDGDVSAYFSGDPFGSPDQEGASAGHIDWQGPIDRCIFDEGYSLAYAINRTGQPEEAVFDSGSPIAGLGFRILNANRIDPKPNFNWHTTYLDGQYGYWWSPQLSPEYGGKPGPLYERNGVFGIPDGDRYLYYLATNNEIDFTSYATCTSPFQWVQVPNQLLDSCEIFVSQVMLTTQLGDMLPGQTANIVFSISAADSIHTDPLNYRNNFNPTNPAPFMKNLRLDRLAKASRYMDWVYDNPGYDSDGDGYRGEFRICDFDTVWYKGDGIPDFRADIPPPPPYVRIETENNRLRLRWNGYRTESATDLFTNEKDFEGYRVYLGRDERESSMSLVTSYDIENFNRFRFVTYANGDGRWEVTELPFSLDSLRLLFSDSLFDPLAYTRSNPLRVADSFFYFEKNDANNSDLTLPSGVRKAYPDAPRPNDDSSLWSAEEVTYEHDSLRLPKFYEYEYTIDSINAAVPWYVAVTAFDFGFASGGLPPAESEIKETITSAYAQTSAQQVVANNLEAYVYPNPYRVDGGYSAGGYENRDNYLPEEKGRLLHFANLPHLCTIQIYSLDGDRIITLEHDREPNAPDAMHHTWDLITRNRQLITSGLYYYVIESPLRATQIGKFVVIK